MENKQMADYTLTIKADSGYESETEGRCTAEQYGQAIAALHGEASQRKPLTDEQIDEAWSSATGGSIVTDDMRAFARTIYSIKE